MQRRCGCDVPPSSKSGEHDPVENGQHEPPLVRMENMPPPRMEMLAPYPRSHPTHMPANLTCQTTKVRLPCRTSHKQPLNKFTRNTKASFLTSHLQHLRSMRDVLTEHRCSDRRCLFRTFFKPSHIWCKF